MKIKDKSLFGAALLTKHLFCTGLDDFSIKASYLRLLTP